MTALLIQEIQKCSYFLFGCHKCIELLLLLLDEEENDDHVRTLEGILSKNDIYLFQHVLLGT